MLKIVSKNGIDVSVLLPDGTSLKGITDIEILPMSPAEPVQAKITFSRVMLEMEVGNDEMIKQLEAALAIYKDRKNARSQEANNPNVIASIRANAHANHGIASTKFADGNIKFVVDPSDSEFRGLLPSGN